jgi:Spx/MgsR family transcriptional regulator
MLKIYGIKNCDSVRKAIKYLKSQNIPYEFIDFRETPIGKDTISQWLKSTKIDVLFNTRGTTYRTLKLKELKLNEQEKADWLAKENMLIKRPVVALDNKIIVGYNESQYLENIHT